MAILQLELELCAEVVKDECPLVAPVAGGWLDLDVVVVVHVVPRIYVFAQRVNN